MRHSANSAIAVPNQLDARLSPDSRRAEPGELRTRSGCWKCRERRVKCPGQRPVCRHCERLGFVCEYDIRLQWQAITVPRCGAPRAGTGPRRQPLGAGRCIFINAYHEDFSEPTEPDTGRYGTPRPMSPDALQTPTAKDSVSEHAGGPNQDLMFWRPLSLACPSPIALQPKDASLWEYFDKSIAPQCALDNSANPYRNLILRVAASSPGGPLFHCVLAASANQLHNLGHTGFERSMWQHRASALRLLRQELEASSYEESALGLPSRRTVAQVVGSSIMLCFFEILRDCSESWTVHTEFAVSYLHQYVQQSGYLDSEEQQLVRFSMAYSSSHNILAATASSRPFTPALMQAEDPTLQTLTGCSHQLLSLISATSQLARDQATQGKTAESAARRHDIERQLSALHRPVPQEDGGGAGAGDDDAELALVAETKRLTALLYLYSRVDGAGPHEPHVVRLTARILSLIQRISLRTNTTLWPLFMVGTLGVRPQDDGHRRLVLDRLTALQATRQLGNVKKARRIVERVWKARDLRTAEADKAWSILAGRHGTISLA